MALVAIPLALGGAALVAWLARVSSGTKAPSSAAVTSKPPLPTFTEEPVFAPPPPPPTPAPELPMPVVRAPAEKPAPLPPAPIEPAPIERAPIEPAPIEPAPIERAPIERAPIEPAPIERAPIEPTPAPPAPPPPLPEPAPAPAQEPAPLPPAPLDIEPPPAPAGPPAGYDPAKAKALAKQVAANVDSKKYDYDRALTKRFQLAAGIPDDANYGPETKGALLHFGIRRPPRALFRGADGTYADVPYKWA